MRIVGKTKIRQKLPLESRKISPVNRATHFQTVDYVRQIRIRFRASISSLLLLLPFLSLSYTKLAIAEKLQANSEKIIVTDDWKEEFRWLKRIICRRWPILYWLLGYYKVIKFLEIVVLFLQLFLSYIIMYVFLFRNSNIVFYVFSTIKYEKRDTKLKETKCLHQYENMIFH